MYPAFLFWLSIHVLLFLRIGQKRLAIGKHQAVNPYKVYLPNSLFYDSLMKRFRKKKKELCSRVTTDRNKRAERHKNEAKSPFENLEKKR